MFWVLLIAWAIACMFYAVKLFRVLRERGISLFALFGKSYKDSYSRKKAMKLFFNIVIATFIFIVTILIAYFVRSSS
ncbi:MAG: hypothetical protein WDN26_14585 [Chitinophagaceae bacterium]